MSFKGYGARRLSKTFGQQIDGLLLYLSMEDNIMMISGNAFKQMLAEAAYEGAKKALNEIGTQDKVRKEWLSLKDAVSFLSDKGISISMGHLKNLTYRDEIPSYKINRKLSFLPQDLELWVERNAQSSRQSLEDAACGLARSAQRKGAHSKTM